jgi:hypothetical protein
MRLRVRVDDLKTRNTFVPAGILTANFPTRILGTILTATASAPNSSGKCLACVSLLEILSWNVTYRTNLLCDSMVTSFALFWRGPWFESGVWGRLAHVRNILMSFSSTMGVRWWYLDAARNFLLPSFFWWICHSYFMNGSCGISAVWKLKIY